MGDHLTADGVFKSDKFDWCPEGFLVLKFTDLKARGAIIHYANVIADVDPGMAEDIRQAMAKIIVQQALKGKPFEEALRLLGEAKHCMESNISIHSTQWLKTRAAISVFLEVEGKEPND